MEKLIKIINSSFQNYGIFYIIDQIKVSRVTVFLKNLVKN